MKSNTMLATEVKALRCSECGEILWSIPVYDHNRKFDGIRYEHPGMSSTLFTPCRFVGRLFEPYWPPSVRMEEVKEQSQ
jgi:hypothetical protein